MGDLLAKNSLQSGRGEFIRSEKFNTPKKGGEGGGGPNFIFPQNLYYFFLGAHAKIWNPTITPSVVLNSGGNNKNNKKEKKKIPKIVATYVFASCQGQRTHYAPTKIVAYLSLLRWSNTLRSDQF